MGVPDFPGGEVVTHSKEDFAGLPTRLYRKVEHMGLPLDGKDVDDLYRVLNQAGATVADATLAEEIRLWLLDIRKRCEALP